ncbi:unnamed protein product [Blepharisma stoltei]|uniref:Cytochrome b5 heme-binding domain-containing protein n=1 Tax=Blepharisma stoltei TaxID=1481888 RepID=A0AAU9IRX1_9CILI|nr:unnamed protein product [Blepharisma stoltei]
MEGGERSVQFIYGRSAVTLKWDSSQISEDMAMDTIDNLGKRFLSHFQGSILHFKDQEGNITSIAGIVMNLVSPIFVVVDDAAKHQYDFDKIKAMKDRKFVKHECYRVREDGACVTDQDILRRSTDSDLASSASSPSIVAEQQSEKEPKTVGRNEVAKHNKKQDCWTILNGKVYNITSFISSHPGGDIIMQCAGTDGTQLFNRYHGYLNPDDHVGRSLVGNLSQK